jgi:hypothetical protein
VQTPPFLGDTTSNQAIIFSAPFSPSVQTKPTYPNYTLPPANLSVPTPPASSPNFTLVVAPSSSSPSLPSLPQTACMLSAQGSTGTVRNQSLWLRDEEGWRSQWLLEGLSPATNYTAYVIQDNRKVSGPMYFATKSGMFSVSSASSIVNLTFIRSFSILRMSPCIRSSLLFLSCLYRPSTAAPDRRRCVRCIQHSIGSDKSTSLIPC